ncbi:pif-2 [Alphabaculovirus alterspexiguae]|uniref:Pif-2 n=1 Tax=Spodoptera exigua multiple nucleopolyhedrovirus TaxID=10454 RepID=A0A3G2JTX2_9ABAC|nr:pif-2 [Spodoptera exigua multiple nucleopolyhedrovirus]AYN44987.1 pif-2 [Spodoptera exigua multiple nucleopolyhedrovirus]
MFLLLFICVAIFLFLLYKPMYDAHAKIKILQTEYNDTVDQRIDYMKNILQRRRFVPLSALPTIDFNTNLGTINEGEVKCLSMPIYVSSVNAPNYDCSLICDNPSAAYFFVDEYDKFIVNGQMLVRGGYCTTSSVPRNCNRETSLILHSLNQWTCIAEDPRYFSGPQNVYQVAGRQHTRFIAPNQARNNVLFDRLLGVEVDINRNTFRSSWDELMSDGSGRRFQMRCNALDNNNNRMILNPFNPIECLPNVCTNVMYVAPGVGPNFETGECECGDFNVTRVRHVVPNDPTSMCAAITDTFDTDSMSFQFRTECMNLDMPIEKYNTKMLWCPSEIFNINTDNAYTFTVPGSFPLSEDGNREMTWRFIMDNKQRITFESFYPTPDI